MVWEKKWLTTLKFWALVYLNKARKLSEIQLPHLQNRELDEEALKTKYNDNIYSTALLLNVG